MAKKIVLIGGLVVATLSLGACEALCHGADHHHGREMRRFWD